MIDSETQKNALSQWRQETAQRFHWDESQILTENQIDAIIKYQPQSMQALYAIQEIGCCRVGRHGMEILGILKSCSSTPEQFNLHPDNRFCI